MEDPLDDYTALNDPARRRQVERRGGYFVVEGMLAFRALLGSPYPLRSVLVTEGKAAAVRHLLATHGRHDSGHDGRHDGQQDGQQDGRHDGRHDGQHDGQQDGRYDDRHDDRHDGRHDSGHDGQQDGRYDDRVDGGAGRAPGGEDGGDRGHDGGPPVLVRPESEVAAVTGFAFHRGVLAAADRLPLPPPSAVVAGARRLAVLEGLNDHENLGALFRNAAAFAVDAVLADPTTADPLYRRSVRVSLGHVLRVPWTRIADWPGGLGELRAAGFHVVALTPAADAEPIDVLAAAPPERIALVVGAEGPGLSPAALAVADRRTRIPLAPGVDSLNVATAAAVAFHRLTTW